MWLHNREENMDMSKRNNSALLQRGGGGDPFRLS